MKLDERIFEKAKSIIRDLIEDYDIKYPLDVFDLSYRMGFELIPYSQYNDHIELLMKISKDGFSHFHENKKIWTIYYNENVNKKERIKFTIAHEIGHILLQKDTEKYANFFAGYLLAPVPLILEYKLYSQEKIKDYFKVGDWCANSCFNRAMSRLTCKISYTDYEKFIIKSQK